MFNEDKYGIYHWQTIVPYNNANYLLDTTSTCFLTQDGHPTHKWEIVAAQRALEMVRSSGYLDTANPKCTELSSLKLCWDYDVTQPIPSDILKMHADAGHIHLTGNGYTPANPDGDL